MLGEPEWLLVIWLAFSICSGQYKNLYITSKFHTFIDSYSENSTCNFFNRYKSCSCYSWNMNLPCGTAVFQLDCSFQMWMKLSNDIVTSDWQLLVDFLDVRPQGRLLRALQHRKHSRHQPGPAALPLCQIRSIPFLVAIDSRKTFSMKRCIRKTVTLWALTWLHLIPLESIHMGKTKQKTNEKSAIGEEDIGVRGLEI